MEQFITDNRELISAILFLIGIWLATDYKKDVD